MTKFHYETIHCPYCLNEEDLPIWDIVDVSEDPDLKNKVFLKELQNYECQNCNRKYTLDQPFLYLDPRSKVLIYYAPRFSEILLDKSSRDEQGNLKKEISSSMPLDFGVDIEDYTLRICYDYNDLIEKLHVFDFDLDDKLIEVIKFATRSNPPAVEDENGNRTIKQIEAIYFVGIENSKYIFQTFSEDEVWRQIALDAEVYDNAETYFADKFTEDENWNIVDFLGCEIFLLKNKF